MWGALAGCTQQPSRRRCVTVCLVKQTSCEADHSASGSSSTRRSPPPQLCGNRMPAATTLPYRAKVGACGSSGRRLLQVWLGSHQAPLHAMAEDVPSNLYIDRRALRRQAVALVLSVFMSDCCVAHSEYFSCQLLHSHLYIGCYNIKLLRPAVEFCFPLPLCIVCVCACLS